VPETTVKDADESVAESPEGSVVGIAGFAMSVIERPSTG